MIGKYSWCGVTNAYFCKGVTPVAGVAIPLTATALEWFKRLQRNLNRLLAKDKQPLLSVDGRIGNQTVAALKRYCNSSWPPIGGAIVDCSAVNHASAANYADEINAAVYIQALMSFAPEVPDPGTGTPSVASGTSVINPPKEVIQSENGTSLSDVLKTPLGMAAAVVGVLLISRAVTSSKPKRKGKKR